MRVTLDTFSGRPNPSWVLSKKDAKRLVDSVARKALPSVDSVESILGFRGYIISSDSDEEPLVGLPHEFRIGGTSFDQFVAPKELALATLTPQESDDIAVWLLSTAQKAVEDEVLSYVEQTVKTRNAGSTAEKSKKRSSGKAPDQDVVDAACLIQNTPYNPAFWNVPQTQPYNNCYNYAMNYRSNTFAQPGKISGHPNNIMQCANVGTAANWDGCKTTCSGSNKNVALVIWPNVDYHWYRLHSNGFWGHKPGSTAARNTDNSGQVIGGARNPQNCNRGNYTIFCGYRYSPTGMQVK
jgi:hypothetical protein